MIRGGAQGRTWPAALDQVLERAQLAQADRAAGVELLGRVADLRAHPELAAVGEARRGVDVDAGGVDLELEGPRRSRCRPVTIASEWPLPWRLMCSIASSTRVDDADRHLQRQVLGVPVLIGRGADRQVGDAARARVRRRAASRRRRAARAARAAGTAPATSAWTSSVSAALQTPGPLDLGVDDDLLRGVEVGAAVDVDVAVARGGEDHRHGGDALERRLQALAAARDDQVDDAGLRRELGAAPRGRRRRPATARPSGSPAATRRLGGDRRRAPRWSAPPSSSRAARSRCRTSGTARRRRSSRSGAPRRRPRRRRAARAPCGRRARWAGGSRRSPRRPGRAAPRSCATPSAIAAIRARVEREAVEQRRR